MKNNVMLIVHGFFVKLMRSRGSVNDRAFNAVKTDITRLMQYDFSRNYIILLDDLKIREFV